MKIASTSLLVPSLLGFAQILSIVSVNEHYGVLSTDRLLLGFSTYSGHQLGV